MLAAHQKVQEKLYKEIVMAFKQAKKEKEPGNGRATFDMFKRMPYLDGVVFETIRLFPAVPVDPKQAARDSLLPNGVVVPEGTVITFEP